MTATPLQRYHFHLQLAPLSLSRAEQQHLINHTKLTLEQISQLNVQVIASLPDQFVADAAHCHRTDSKPQPSNHSLPCSSSVQANLAELHPSVAHATPRLTLSYYIGIGGSPYPFGLTATTDRQSNQRPNIVASSMAQPSHSHVLHNHLSNRPLASNHQPIDMAQLEAAIGWHPWQEDQVKFSNYLWEQTCLECFVTGNGAEYVELNAAPAGAFALYHFDDYRQPATLPPRPLVAASRSIATANGSTFQSMVQWHPQASSAPHFGYLPHATIEQDYKGAYLSRHLSIDLTQLPPSLSLIRQLHPCVIIYIADIAFYFAAQHASPPDFHNRRYWRYLQSC